jgi:hypothetical protein
MLGAGAHTDLFARGDGGTPLVAALFWGHREVVGLLGREPVNLRVAAGLGDLELIRELAGTPQAGVRRGFYRPHGGFPAWQPSDEPQEVLDEALVWAAKADRMAPTPTSAAPSADPITARVSPPSTSPPRQDDAKRSRRCCSSAPTPRIRDSLHEGDALGWARVGGHEDLADLLQ